MEEKMPAQHPLKTENKIFLSSRVLTVPEVIDEVVEQEPEELAGVGFITAQEVERQGKQGGLQENPRNFGDCPGEGVRAHRVHTAEALPGHRRLLMGQDCKVKRNWTKGEKKKKALC